MPGTEGLGISDVIFGDRNFKVNYQLAAKTINEANHSIIMDRYRDTNYDDVLYQFPYGYGLTYTNWGERKCKTNFLMITICSGMMNSIKMN